MIFSRGTKIPVTLEIRLRRAQAEKVTNGSLLYRLQSQNFGTNWRERCNLIINVEAQLYNACVLVCCLFSWCLTFLLTCEEKKEEIWCFLIKGVAFYKWERGKDLGRGVWKLGHIAHRYQFPTMNVSIVLNLRTNTNKN